MLRTVLLRAATAVLVPAAALSTVAAAPAAAAGPRPLFQLPFTCGARITLSTYPGHGDFEIDMSAAEGTPVLAAAAGTAFRGSSTTGGNQVSILHDNGWRTLYLHLQDNSYRFTDGQRVEQGQHVANSGNTGTRTSGPHLHFEQQNLIDGRWRAVQSWFNAVPADITDDARHNSYTDTSHNCGGGNARHQVRRADGSWTGFADVSMGAVTQVADAADLGGNTHVLAISRGQINHRLRFTAGNWTPWGLLGNPGTATAVTGATDGGGDLHVATVVGGQILHRIRFTAGNWTPWGVLGNPGTAGAVAGAVDSSRGQFHLVAVLNGQVQHRLRNADGSWTPWGFLGNGGTAGAVGAAADADGNLHVTAVVDGQVYHRIRFAGTGGWSPWGLLGNPGEATAVSAAVDPANGTVHVVAVLNWQVHHRLFDGGEWTPWGVVGNPGLARSVAASADPGGNLHVVASS